MKYIDKIEIMLRGRTGDLFPYYIDVLDNTLAHKWLDTLNNLLDNGNHLEIIKWLKKNKLDPDDPKLTLGHPKVGSVNMTESFPMSNFTDMQTILKRHLDVYRIRTTGHELYFDYRWSDRNYDQSQMVLL